MTQLTPRSLVDDPPATHDAAWAGPSPAQQYADTVSAAARTTIRNPLFRPAPPPPALSQDVIDIRLAEEIDYIRRMLDALGEQLADDPIVLNRHMAAMQGFDLIGQMLGHVSRVVQTADRKVAIETVMPDMRARLQRRALFVV